MNGLPLDGITVVEVAEGVAGPFCGRLLASFGADVIKIEPPPNGDRTRGSGPHLPDVPPVEASTLFLHLNMGKKSVQLDWRSRTGASTLEGLLASADVLIEDWDERTSAEFGSGAIKSANSRLVDLSLTPFGTTGPYAAWKSTPLVSMALGGFLYLSGDEDREPLMIPGVQSEYLAGLHGYSGVMMALWERDRTGTGGRVEVSEIESLATLHQFTTVMHTYSGLVRSRHGARWENKGAYGRYPITVLPCKDGYVAFAVSTEGQWELLFPMVGRPELLQEPRFATFVERRQQADEIDSVLIEWMADKTRKEVFEFAAGTWSEPASPLLDLSEVLEDRQLIHRQLFAEVTHPDAGTLTFPTVPYRMSLTQPRFTRAPRLGEHSGEVLSGRRFDATTPAPRRRTSSQQRGLLEDIRVLDLTRVWAGPLATRILGDFGAEIIKISDPRVPLDRLSGTNNKLNRNKPNLALRLDREEGQKLFLELAAISDVVVENFRPRVMRNFGLTFDRIREVRPDIVMCSMPGFGTTGAYAEYPAFGPSVEAMTGLPSMMGYEGGPPRTSSLAYPDLVAALNSVAAITTALRHRRLNGEGQFIDLALTEGPICQIGEYIAINSRTGWQPPRVGNAHPRHAPYGVYPAVGEDNWIAICVTSDSEWQELCKAMGRPGLAIDPRLRNEGERRRRMSDVDELVSDWSSGLDASWLAVELQRRGIAAGRVAKNWELLSDPHLNERDFFVELTEPDVGPKKYPGQAIRMAELRRSNWKPSARLGEDSREIMLELLGRRRNEFEELVTTETSGVFRED